VIEANIKSGALINGSFGQEENRKAFTMHVSVDSHASSRGSHLLSKNRKNSSIQPLIRYKICCLQIHTKQGYNYLSKNSPSISYPKVSWVSEKDIEFQLIDRGSKSSRYPESLCERCISAVIFITSGNEIAQIYRRFVRWTL
jgi:predicted Rossmann fold nucleotide-binding protein DprA/Smf involved in DNA uptake